MSLELPAAYGQLLSMGVLWISVHCAGMCGPLLNGLDLSGARKGFSFSQGGARVVAYQAGKALTYALLGALAGLLGKGFSSIFRQQGAFLFFLISLVIGGYAFKKMAGMLGWRRPETQRNLELISLSLPASGKPPKRMLQGSVFLSGVRKGIAYLSGERSLTATLALGALLGLLPCMIPAWVLTLAASTGSILHGALLMVLLVLLNSPVIALVSLLPHLLKRRLFAHAEKLTIISLLISATWMFLMALAAVDLISHQAWHFSIAEKDFTLMFF